MSTSLRNETLTCEQCGAPLQSRAGESDCLHCLLTTGFAFDAPGTPLPNEFTTRRYDHYEILLRPDGSLWELGRGAMGVTYKARDLNLNTCVALKIISAQFAGRLDARQRFLREARAAARLRHPNVARVFHFGVIHTLPQLAGAAASVEDFAEGGDCFYAMEFIEGETLEARVRREGPLSPSGALEITLEVTRALAAAEKGGLVHRDLKPANIMLVEGRISQKTGLTNEFWVKVIDFGLAQAETEKSVARDRRRFFGTLAFASPEQIADQAVDIRSDIYSLGVTLFYALTGEVPKTLPGTKSHPGIPATLSALGRRKVPDALVALLRKMLAENPAQRPGSAEALEAEVNACFATIASARRRTKRVRTAVWAAGFSLAAVIAGLAIVRWLVPSHPLDKSIAVLPFRNLNHDPSNAFFVDGMEDDLLSRLVKIRDLRVISRLGTVRFSPDQPRDFPAIGRTLGVSNLLAGEVGRTGDQIFLRVSLIDARDGHEIWSEDYNRRLADAINLQGELAGVVAETLDAHLSPQESVGVRSAPTRNPDAYVLYLRGRKFERTLTFAISDYESAQALYRQAIALDPGFALAHARLASTLGLLYRFRGPNDELKREAYAEAREALRLRPDLGEAHLAKALCAYRIDRDYEAALPELKAAARLMPNDTEAESFIAYIDRREGNWLEARSELERCAARDPQNVTFAEELYTTSYSLRDWPRARLHIRQAEALTPAVAMLKAERALVDLWQNGDLLPLQKVFRDHPDYGDREGALTWLRWDTAMLARDFPAAEAAIANFPSDTLPSVYSAPVPKSYLEGCIALAQGEGERAQQFFEQARPSLEAETIGHPEDALRHARLGLLYAYMGRKKEALREGEKATELLPVSSDAFDGPEFLANLALIHARLGDNEVALAMIHDLLRKPGAVSFFEASMSLPELRLRWQWDPLRSDPRFQEILAAPEPATEIGSP